MKTPCVCLHIRRADRQLSQLYDRYLRPAEIRSTQYGMLRCVEDLPTPFISDIGRTLCMDQTTVTRNIEKLEKAGFVTSCAHPDDPRKKLVQLSPSGKAKLAEARPLWEEAQKCMLGSLDEQEFSQLLQLLEKLMTTAQKQARA